VTDYGKETYNLRVKNKYAHSVYVLVLIPVHFVLIYHHLEEYLGMRLIYFFVKVVTDYGKEIYNLRVKNK
jgi:hypothetical protein